MTIAETNQVIVAHVVPSRWVTQQILMGKGMQDVILEAPYKRVVGLGSGQKTTLWAPPEVSWDKNAGYTPDDTDIAELPLTPEASGHLEAFFREFLSIEGSGKIKTDYNCHRFAGWMHGRKDEFQASPNAWADQVVREGKALDRNLKMGELGVIGYRDDALTPNSRAYHSLIGLGEDRDESLQVTWLYGHLGIIGYKSMLDFFQRRINSRHEGPEPVPRLQVFSLAA